MRLTKRQLRRIIRESFSNDDDLFDMSFQIQAKMRKPRVAERLVQDFILREIFWDVDQEQQILNFLASKRYGPILGMVIKRKPGMMKEILKMAQRFYRDPTI